MGEWKTVFRTSFVEVREIDANPPIVVLLFYENGVCQPFGVLDFDNGASAEEFINLVVNNF